MTASAAACRNAVPDAAQTPAACDPRIVRSRAALREALISLIEERGLDSVTVNDLCQRAGLNRGTFYNHFQDKEALLDAFEEEFLEGLAVARDRLSNLEIPDLLAARLAKRPMPQMVDLFDYLRSEGDLLHALLGPGGDARFSPRLREAVCEEFVRNLLHERYRTDASAFVDYYAAFFGGAYLGVICRWVATGMKESSEEMAVIAMRLMFMKPGEAIKM